MVSLEDQIHCRLAKWHSYLSWKSQAVVPHEPHWAHISLAASMPAEPWGLRNTSFLSRALPRASLGSILLLLGFPRPPQVCCAQGWAHHLPKHSHLALSFSNLQPLSTSPITPTFLGLSTGPSLPATVLPLPRSPPTSPDNTLQSPTSLILSISPGPFFLCTALQPENLKHHLRPLLSCP